MSDVLAIAETAMRNSMATLDRVSHNVANTSTPAFKRELSVQQGFDAQLRRAEPSQSEPPRDWSSGPLRFTGDALSFAIEGDGWFQVRSPHGVVLTRNGSFRIDQEGRLTSPQGWPVVLDADASIPPGEVTLRSNAELWVDGARVARFLIADAQGTGLQAAGPGMFRSALPVAEVESPRVKQGYVEGANVNLLNEMVGMIEAMRHAEASQRMMRAYDEAMETALTTLGEF